MNDTLIPFVRHGRALTLRGDVAFEFSESAPADYVRFVLAFDLAIRRAALFRPVWGVLFEMETINDASN